MCGGVYVISSFVLPSVSGWKETIKKPCYVCGNAVGSVVSQVICTVLMFEQRLSWME